MPVNFEEVNRNIEKDGLDTELIRIVYEGLTDFEAKEILAHQGGENLGSGKVLSPYPQDRDPMYKEKAGSIIYLGAD